MFVLLLIFQSALQAQARWSPFCEACYKVLLYMQVLSRQQTRSYMFPSLLGRLGRRSLISLGTLALTPCKRPLVLFFMVTFGLVFLDLRNEPPMSALLKLKGLALRISWSAAIHPCWKCVVCVQPPDTHLIDSWFRRELRRRHALCKSTRSRSANGINGSEPGELCCRDGPKPK